MPNPYHDETGRFCSKGEMGEAVDRLFTQATAAERIKDREQAMNQWFSLKQEYDQINAEVAVVPEEWVRQVTTSGLVAVPETAEGIRAIYNAGLREAMQNDKSGTQVEKIYRILENPDTPQDIREEMQQLPSAEVRAEMVKRLSKAESSAAAPQITAFLDKDITQTPREVASAIFASPKLTFENKYDIARQIPGGMGILAVHEPGPFFQNPELEQELITSLGPWDNPDESNVDAWNLVAARTRDESARVTILERYGNSDRVDSYRWPLFTLLENKTTTEQEASLIFSIIAETDPYQLKGAEETYVRHQERPYNRTAQSILDFQHVTRHPKTAPVLPEQLQRDQETLRELEKKVADYRSLHPRIGPREARQRVLSMRDRINYSTAQARIDAQDLRSLEKELQKLEKNYRSNRNSENVTARADAADRVSGAATYIRATQFINFLAEHAPQGE